MIIFLCRIPSSGRCAGHKARIPPSVLAKIHNNSVFLHTLIIHLIHNCNKTPAPKDNKKPAVKYRQQVYSRRTWDSNPRAGISGLSHFECDLFDLLSNPPCSDNKYYRTGQVFYAREFFVLCFVLCVAHADLYVIKFSLSRKSL